MQSVCLRKQLSFKVQLAFRSSNETRFKLLWLNMCDRLFELFTSIVRTVLIELKFTICGSNLGISDFQTAFEFATMWHIVWNRYSIELWISDKFIINRSQQLSLSTCAWISYDITLSCVTNIMHSASVMMTIVATIVDYGRLQCRFNSLR